MAPTARSAFPLLFAHPAESTVAPRQGRSQSAQQVRGSEGIIGISYRRDDAGAHAGRLYDRLTQRFGFDRVFMDVDAILPGEDFVQTLRGRIDKAAAWLVVIGPNWAHSKNSRGERRLDDPDDFVRIEVATALERDIRVIPALVEGAAMPRSEELPPEIQALVRRTAIALDHSSFHQDVDQLIYALESLGAPSRPTRRPSEASLAEATLEAAESAQIQLAQMQAFQRRWRRRLSLAVAIALLLVTSLGAYLYLQRTGKLPGRTATMTDPGDRFAIQVKSIASSTPVEWNEASALRTAAQLLNVSTSCRC
jgi:TIR domain